MRTLRLGSLAAVMVAAVAASAAAQDDTGVRVYEEQLRVRLDEQVSGSREAGFDAGGWLNFALFHFEDIPPSGTRNMRQYELRGWASFDFRKVHSAYVRGRLGWESWNGGDHPVTGRECDNEQEIERAWYRFSFHELMRNQTGEYPPYGFSVKVGRQYATIGTSLVLSMPLDMIRFDATAGDFEFMALLGQTIHNSPNLVDNSPQVWDHQDRCFYGFELGYGGFARHRPFVYFLSQNDHTQPEPPTPLQAFDYESSYLGVGSEGSVLLPDLHYRAEFVGQWGHTFSSGATTYRDDICAAAFDAELKYYFQTAMRPAVSFEYIYATGDGDRGTSATSTVGGNTAGSKDNAFNAFGFRDTGIAFAPEVSNLHMYALGGSLYPLESVRGFERMEVGTKLFWYHKADKGGPISDTTATNTDAQCLGWEWDIYANWRITSDVSWTVRYGCFQPGGAFDGGDETSRHFLYTGITFSF